MLTIFLQRCRGRGPESDGVEQAGEEDDPAVYACRGEAVAAGHGATKLVIEGREDGNLCARAPT